MMQVKPSKQERAAAVARMLERTADLMGVDAMDILGYDRTDEVLRRARLAFYWITRPVIRNHELAAVMGRRSHGTIDSARSRCRVLIERNEEFRAQVGILMDECAFDRERYKI